MTARGTLLTTLLAFACMLGAMPGCASTTRNPDEVVVWTGFESELPTLRELAEEFQRQSSVPVRVVKVPFSSLRDKFLVATPAGQGPDVLIGPQDWVGILTTAGLLDPIPPEAFHPEQKAGYLPNTLQAMTCQGTLYGIPLVADCVALIRNPELVSSAPASLDELLAAARAAQTSERYGFYYEIEDLYFSWPFFAAFGAEMFAHKGAEIDPDRPQFDSPQAVQAADFLYSLRRDGMIPVSATTDLARSLYLQGRAGMILNGPWFLSDLRKSGVPYAIDPIPGRDGHPASPLVTVQGAMLSNRAQARSGAVRFLQFLSQAPAQRRIALASGRPPANRAALEEATRDPRVGPDLAAFARVLETGIPMPNHPAVSTVWEPMKQALELITAGEPASVQLPVTQAIIRRKIRQMME